MYCDPILRLPRRDAKLKKYLSDQIKNCLSEATTGASFLGWEMRPDMYMAEQYAWCLTYEQSLSQKNKTNRKFRILLASKGLVDLCLLSQPWEVFRSKQNKNYTSYCDRRWFHLKTMGEILKVKRDTRKDENIGKLEKKQTLDWLNTFFIDTIEVVAPKLELAGSGPKPRAWKDREWLARHRNSKKRAKWDRSDEMSPRGSALNELGFGNKQE